MKHFYNLNWRTNKWVKTYKVSMELLNATSHLICSGEWLANALFIDTSLVLMTIFFYFIIYLIIYSNLKKSEFVTFGDSFYRLTYCLLWSGLRPITKNLCNSSLHVGRATMIKRYYGPACQLHPYQWKRYSN